jgi:hypothetical protein
MRAKDADRAVDHPHAAGRLQAARGGRTHRAGRRRRGGPGGQADQAAQGLRHRLRTRRPCRPGGQGNGRDHGACRPTCRSACRPKKCRRHRCAGGTDRRRARPRRPALATWARSWPRPRPVWPGRPRWARSPPPSSRPWRDDRAPDADISCPCAPWPTTSAWPRSSRPKRWPKPPALGFRSVVNNRPDFEHGPISPPTPPSKPQRGRGPAVPLPARQRHVPVARADRGLCAAAARTAAPDAGVLPIRGALHAPVPGRTSRFEGLRRRDPGLPRVSCAVPLSRISAAVPYSLVARPKSRAARDLRRHP